MIPPHPARRAAPDRRDLEIERLKRQLAEARARERAVRTEERERFSALTAAGKRFAVSMRSRLDERQRQQRRLDAQYAVSRVLEESRDLPGAAAEIFRVLGARLGWRVGVLWTVEAGALSCEGLWRAPGAPTDGATDGAPTGGGFEEACRGSRFPRGAGLPGRVWRREEPCWVEDVLADEAYPRRDAAAAAGLRCALAFPIQDGGRLLGVFELLKEEPAPADEDTLRTVYLVGHQMGQFVERRRAEAERDRALFREREARKQVSGVLESINDAFFALDRDWRFTYVNRRAEEYLERPRGGLIGRNIWEEFPRTFGSVARREFRRVMEGRETIGFEAVSPVTGLWISARAYPSAEGISVYFRDTTERKEAEEVLRASEERFRALVSKGADMITVSDRDGRTVYASPTTERVCGYTPEEYAALHPFDLIHPEDRPRCEEAFRRLADEPGLSLDLQHRFRHKDGTWRWVEGTFTGLFHDPAIGGLVANVHDVTERRETEVERDRLRALEWVASAEAAERARISRELHDRVAHSMGVAHQSLQLYGVIAARDAARAAEKLELAKEMTKASLESTRNLSAELRELDAEEGLEQEIRHLLDVSVPPGVRTEVSVEGNESPVPGHVRGQLFLVLREAVRNAVAHSECASISVGLAFDREEVRGRVEDDGRGFDPEDGNGGVGLRSMRERAALLDGALELSGGPGRGARVEVVVPLKGRR